MNNIFNKIYWFLFFLIRPSFWQTNYDYNEKLDTALRKKLEEGKKFTSIGRYEASFDGVTIWTANYPFAGMTVGRIGQELRPSKEIIYKLNKQLRNDIVDESLKELT